LFANFCDIIPLAVNFCILMPIVLDKTGLLSVVVSGSVFSFFRQSNFTSNSVHLYSMMLRADVKHTIRMMDTVK
jgi:hypothetical protein